MTNVLPCGVCHTTSLSTALNYCMDCRNSVCTNCTGFHYPNRSRLGICARCSSTAAAKGAPVPDDPPFVCGRCGGRVSANQLEFFCDMCAVPLCARCLWTSFENGRLKCSNCCDVPTARQLNQAHIRHLIDDAFLLSLQVPLVSTAKPSTAPVGRPRAGGGSGAVGPSPSTATSGGAPSKYRKLLGKVKLGEGAQGVVYKCRTEDNEVVVSKEMIFDDLDEQVFESQERQVERMRRLNHPHLIRYLDVISQRDPFRICVVMPYYDEGDLKLFIERQRRPVPEVKLCSIMLQIAGALKYLHTQDPPLVHRDIKPENILLLNNEEQVLLMDLDLCRSIDLTASTLRMRSASPTYEYRAPELATTMGSTKSDVFSLGVVMYVLATLPEFPCVKTDSGEELVMSASDWTPDSLDRAIRRAMKRVRGYTYSEGFIRLLIRLVTHDPAQRPTSDEVEEALTQVMERKLMEGEE